MIKDKVEVEGRKMTRMEAVSIYCHSKNKGNRDAIRRGYNLTDEVIDKIVGQLKPEEIKFGDDLMRIVQSKGPEVAEVLRELNGEKMELEPDYFPLHRVSEMSTKALEAMKDADLFKRAYYKTSVGRKFTISRVGNADPPDLSLQTTLIHLDQVNHFIANARAVRDFQKILYDKDVKRAVEANAGEGAYREMSDWLKEWANPRQGYYGTVDKIAGVLRHNTTLVSLGAKVSTMVLQPLAYAQLINRIGSRNAMAGLIDFYRHPYQNAQVMYDLSPTMKSRMHSFDRDLLDFFNTDTWWRQYPGMKEAAMYGISITDLATTAPAWWSAYNLGMKKFNWNQERAVEYADKIVRTTQASGLQKDLPWVLRGSNFKKSFAMFYTYFSSTFNEAARDVRARGAGEISTPQLMRTFMWLFLVPTVVETLIKKREDFTTEEAAKNLIANIATTIPYLGPLINAATSGFDYQASPVFELPKEILWAMKSKEPAKKLKHTVMAMGYLTGFPARQAVLTAQYLADVLSGRSYDPTDLIYRKKEKKGGKWR